MSKQYVITKSSFLGGWTVVSPGPQCEGTTLDSLPEVIAWMDTHAMERFEQFYENFTVPEPGQVGTW